MDYCIPKAVLPQRHNLPWLSKEIIQLIKKRDHHFKKAQHGSAADRAKFRELRNQVVAKLRSGKRSFFADLESSNVNQFWKKIRLLNRKESSIPTLSTGDITASTNPEKAELLNEYFSSNFNSAVPALDYCSIPTALPDDCPDEILCTEEDVFALLSTLDCSKASGTDDISARMLKMTAFSIAAPIAQIFNTSISLGDLPHEWKTARVIPIPKGAASSDPSKYRPISLLSVLSKLSLEAFYLITLIGSLLSAICNGVSLAASLLLELYLECH